MTEHVAIHDDHHGHHNDPESIAKEKRKYLIVFGMLAMLTILTVAAAELLHLPPWETVLVALAIAVVKGSLVAAVFMHLMSERKLIYAVLVLTVFFFGMMIWGPWHHRDNVKHTWPGADQTNKGVATDTAGAAHGGH